MAKEEAPSVYVVGGNVLVFPEEELVAREGLRGTGWEPFECFDAFARAARLGYEVV